MGTTDSDEESTTDAASGEITKSLSLGESFTNPIGNTLTVHDMRLTDSVEYVSNYGDNATVTQSASEGKQWVVVTLEITNDSGKKQYLTPIFEVKVRANGTTYDHTAINTDEGAYSPAEVEDGGSRKGWVPYEVPGDLALADVEVVHSNSADGESWTVTWSAA